MHETKQHQPLLTLLPPLLLLRASLIHVEVQGVIGDQAANQLVQMVVELVVHLELPQPQSDLLDHIHVGDDAHD